MKEDIERLIKEDLKEESMSSLVENSDSVVFSEELLEIEK